MIDSSPARFPQVLLLIAPSGAERAAALRERMESARPGAERSFLLSCDFAQGGPWAGIRDLLRQVVEELLEARSELLTRHAYEIVHVLPTLRHQVLVQHESLTDISLGSERVRNFPADRANRIVHGLINLLAELPERGPWTIACDSLDRSGPIARLFFRELVRRRGSRLDLVLLAGIEKESEPGLRAMLEPFVPVETFALSCQAGWPEPASPEVWTRRAEVLEQRAAETLDRQELLPDLVHAWHQAGEEAKQVRWQLKALELYPTLGFYEDALLYSAALRGRDDLEKILPSTPDIRWLLFFKTFVSLASLQRPEEALRLAEHEGMNQIYDVQPMYRAQILYLIAMLHVRFLPRRDFARGEELLEAALEEIERIADPQDRVFSYVFNRNGLALVRNLQGRRHEAIAYCKEGYDLLQSELGSDKHRLHRSVLIYNIAQVYLALGSQEEAIAHYTAAIAMDPHYSEYFNERGSLFLAMDCLEDAYKDYCSAIVLSPPYPEVFTNLGQCCRRLRRYDEAVRAYTLALDLKPDIALAYAGRAAIYDELGLAEEALADYDAALRLQPEAADLLANRAILRYNAGQLEEALDDLDRAIQSAPTIPELYENRALLLSELRREQEAAGDLRHLLSLLPADSDARPEIEARLQALG